MTLVMPMIKALLFHDDNDKDHGDNENDDDNNNNSANDKYNDKNCIHVAG
jgi:hypothetical protein